MKRVIIILLAVVALNSCFLETSYNTELIIKPLYQSESGGEYIDLEGVVAFAFDASSDDWAVESYEHALEGIVTAIDGGQNRGPVSWSTPISGSSYVSMVLQQEEVMMVVVDTQNQIYAYSDFDIAINLGELYLSLVFMPWKSSDYTSSGWTYVVPSQSDDE